MRDRRLSYNPAEGVKLPRATRPEPVFLSHQQVDRLAEACIEYELFIRLLAYTGLRWAEATALQVKRLDLMRRRLEVVRTAIDLGQEITYGTPKTHQRRSVPIPGLWSSSWPSTSPARARMTWCSPPRAAPRSQPQLPASGVRAGR